MNELKQSLINMTKMLNPLRRVNLMQLAGNWLQLDENGPTITHQIDAHPAGRGMNSGLARAVEDSLVLR